MMLKAMAATGAWWAELACCGAPGHAPRGSGGGVFGGGVFGGDCGGGVFGGDGGGWAISFDETKRTK